MAESGGSEKTEQATQKKKEDERKKGNVFSSKDIVTAFFILVLFGAFRLLAPTYYTAMTQSMTTWLTLCGDYQQLTVQNLRSLIMEGLKTVFLIAGPLLLLCMVVNVAFTGAQTKFNFAMKSLKPKFSRMNPIEGIKKLFALRGLVELAKSLIKIAVIAALVYNEITDSMGEVARLLDVEIITAVVYIASKVFSIAMSIGVAFLFVGGLDYGYQWWDHNRQMKMTKQEVKEEYKQMEGDPQVKGRIKQKQREMAQQRMMSDVPSADVVVRNPTHFAVAVRYLPEKNNAPLVVAKGKDRVALRIVELAEENHIETTENKPLARALYEAVDVGKEIPAEFYQPIAEILAWVYDKKEKKLPYKKPPTPAPPSQYTGRHGKMVTISPLTGLPVEEDASSPAPKAVPRGGGNA